MVGKVSAITVLLLSSLLATPRSAVDYPRGYLLAYNNLADAATLRIAFQKIMDRYADRYGIRLHLYFFRDPHRALHAFEGGHVWTLGAMGRFWALYGEPIIRRAALCYISARQKSTPYATYLLITKKGGQKRLKKGARVTLPGSRDNAEIYLRHYTLKHHGKLPSEFLKLHQRGNSRLALYDLFFDKTDFAVIPQESLKIAEEMNPQISDRIAVIDRSPPVMIYAASCTSRRVAENLLEILKRANKEIRHTPEGREISDMLQIDRQWEADISLFRPYLDYVRETEAMTRQRMRR